MNGTKHFAILVGVCSDASKFLFFYCSLLTENPSDESVVRLIDDAIRKLEVSRENFDVLVSYAARYMIKCGKNLKIMYLNLLHMTCISHPLHNCALKIHAICPNVDNMISKVKAAVLKNTDRRDLFKYCGSPPQPIVTARNTPNCR